MRTMGWRGIAALGLLSVASFAAAQPPPKSKAMPPGWWRDPFGSGAKEEPKQPPAAAKPTASADRAAEQDRLMKAYLRRLAVCDRIRDVALETNDSSLADEADRLNEMAWQLYQEQSSRLLGADAKALEAEPEDNPAAKRASARGPKAGPSPRFRPTGPSGGAAAPRNPTQEGEQ